MKYKIEVTETLQKIVEVEAFTLAEAICAVGKNYSDGEIALDGMDFAGYKICEYKED